jgi:hypothetical protein
LGSDDKMNSANNLPTGTVSAKEEVFLSGKEYNDHQR